MTEKSHMTTLFDQIGTMVASGLADRMPDQNVADSYNEFKELDLSGLGLTQLPDIVCELRLLNGIFLNNNNLAGLPSSLSRLQRLRFMYMNRNQLQTVPRVLGRLKSLARVEMVHNNFIDRDGEIDWIKSGMHNPTIRQAIAGVEIINTRPGSYWSEITFKV